MDCGAHVGTFSRFAFRKGASRVVAIEPDPVNLVCLEQNFPEEISNGRMLVVRAGVWDKRTVLTLSEDLGDNSGGNSFVVPLPHGGSLAGIPVAPLDDIVSELHLVQVDFIKMDIEGSEQNALRGATETLRRFRPRMAICTYHLPDDAKLIPAIVTAVQPSYQIAAKDTTVISRQLRTKVLFFH